MLDRCGKLCSKYLHNNLLIQDVMMIFSGWRHITDHFSLLLPQFPSVDLFLAVSSSLVIPGGVYSLQGHIAARSKLFSGNSKTLDQLNPFSPLNLSQTLNWVVSFGFPEIIISDTVFLSTNCIMSSTVILRSLRLVMGGFPLFPEQFIPSFEGSDCRGVLGPCRLSEAKRSGLL